MPQFFGWLFGSLLSGIWDGVIKPLLKSAGRGVVIYTVVATVINTLFGYVEVFMAPFLLIAGNWWPALGGDFIVSATLFAIKFKISLKILWATAGFK